MSRRFKRTAKLVPVALALTAAVLWYDAFRFEPHHPRLYRQDVHLTGLPQPFDGSRIVHLSDLHIVELGKREQRAARIVQAAEPDLIVLTGDYIKDDGITPGAQRWEQCTEQAIRFLEPLSAPLGKYAVMGNWDSPEVMELLDEAGAAVWLDNEAIPLERDGKRIWLAGVPAAGADLEATLRRVPRDETCALLAHMPADAPAAVSLGADLVLSGHYHGGQVNFPFTGPLCARNTTYVAGLYQVEDCQLYVSRGLGMHTSAVRFRCRAEVTLITLRSRQ